MIITLNYFLLANMYLYFLYKSMTTVVMDIYRKNL